MSERDNQERHERSNIESIKSELYMARYMLVADAYSRVIEAFEMDEADSNYYHLLETDDEEMPVFLRDQTLDPEMYKAVMLSSEDVDYVGEDMVRLVVMLPREYLKAANIDDVPESHQHVIVHRYEHGDHTVSKIGVQGIRQHSWQEYDRQYEAMMSGEDQGEDAVMTFEAEIELLRNGERSPTAYEKLDELDMPTMAAELEELQGVRWEIANYIIWPQRRKKISQHRIFD